MTLVGEDRELRSKIIEEILRTVKLFQEGQPKDNGYPRRRKGEGSREFYPKKIIAENFPNLGKELHLQVKAKRKTYIRNLNTKRPFRNIL